MKKKKKKKSLQVACDTESGSIKMDNTWYNGKVKRDNLL